jgi:hypothetical protein
VKEHHHVPHPNTNQLPWPQKRKSPKNTIM